MQHIIVPTTVDDIDRLIAAQVAENEELEFKRALATSDGQPDSWMAGTDKIGKIAKRELAKEIIAFANSRGGTVILGIGEDGEKRAASKHPVPKCRDLADRLGQSIASSVDPALGSLEAWGIETDGNGDGFVVLKVPASFRAPHRDRDERECYRRVGDRSEPMDMRSIQDLVLLRARGIETVEATLERRSSSMRPQAQEEPANIASQPERILRPCLVRATAVPLEPVYIDGLATRREFHLPLPDLGTGRRSIQQFSSSRWSPVLRGIKAGEDWSFYQRTLLHSGLVETICDRVEWAATNISPTPIGFPLEFMIATAANTVLLAAALRSRLGRPDLEFALDIEWRFPPGAHLLLPLHLFFGTRALPPLEPISRVSDYLLPRDDGLTALLARIESDMLGSFGVHYDRMFDIDMSVALNGMLSN